MKGRCHKQVSSSVESGGQHFELQGDASNDTTGRNPDRGMAHWSEEIVTMEFDTARGLRGTLQAMLVAAPLAWPHQGIGEGCGDPVVSGAGGIEHAVDAARASTRPLKNHQHKMIELTADGSIYLDGASVSRDEFIRRVLGLPPDTSFVIRADRNLVYKELLEVCAILTRLNFSWTIQVQGDPK